MALLMNACTLFFKILALPLYLIEFIGLYSLYKRVFPFMMFRMSLGYNKKMHERKKELFSNLSQFAGPEGTSTILEIGCGPGTNFKYYPTGSKVICTDPNPHFQCYLQEAIDANDHLKYEKFVVSTAEDLTAVSDGAVDVVVSTLVLCSVEDTKRVLEEAHRVLRPVSTSCCSVRKYSDVTSC